MSPRLIRAFLNKAESRHISRQNWSFPLLRRVQNRCVNFPSISKTTRIAILAFAGAFLSQAAGLQAQEGPPPDFSGPPPGAPMQPESVKKQLDRMTHRYSLTSSQQEAIRPLLEDERQKMMQLMEDSSRPPQEKFSQVKGIHEDAAEKIASLLTDQQKKKFEQDEAKRAAREERSPDMEDGPPPDGGPPPPPPQ